MISRKKAAKALLERRKMRKHLSPFVRKVFATVSPGDKYLHNWHIDLMCEYLEFVSRGEITRLIINIPPRYMKSICVSVAWPAWILGQNSMAQIMVSSYSYMLSFKHSQDCRLVLQTDWYKHLFPDVEIASDQNEKRKFTTTKQGHRIATSVGGSATGEGGNYLIVDDPVNPKMAMSDAERNTANTWFNQTFSTRLNDKKKGVMVVIMQRLHQDDLSGHLLEQGGWEHLCIPAVAEKKTIIDFGSIHVEREVGDLLHPDKENKVEIEKAKRTLGTYGFAGQYQQSPSPLGGGIIKISWFRRYATLPSPDQRVQTVQVWDTAQKASEVHNAPWVCGTWILTDNNYYLVDVYREWMTYPEGKQAAISLAAKWNPHAIVIEDKSTGQSLLQELTGLPVIAFEPEGDKVTRLSVESPAIEAGMVFLPDKATWLFDFEKEIANFPNSATKDQADMLSMALKYFQEHGGIFVA